VPSVEAGGRDQTGAPVAAVEGQEELITTAFQTSEGEASDFMPVGDADVIVSVDRVIPESVRPFAEVQDDLRQSWLRRERARRMREMGEAIVTAVNGGQTFAAAARAKPLQHGGDIAPGRSPRGQQHPRARFAVADFRGPARRGIDRYPC
jgi:acyl dehydratase